MTSWRGRLRRWRRVRMKQRGGFVPNEVTGPARSLNPLWARSLGRRRHRTASPFPAALDQRRDARSEVFSKPGLALPFLPRTGPRWVGEIGQASGARAVSSERAGYVTSLGTEPPLCTLWTL